MQTDASKRIMIPLSKSKIALLLLVAIGFVAAGIWLWTISDSQSRYDPLFIRLASILGISFFGSCGIYGIFKLFDSKPGLVLDPDGIDDNSSGAAAGHIPWNEIVGIDITSVHSQKFLTIIVADPVKYVEQGSYLKRKMNAVNLKLYGSPIHISSNTLKIDFQQLTEIVVRYYDQYKTEPYNHCSLTR